MQEEKNISFIDDSFANNKSSFIDISDISTSIESSSKDIPNNNISNDNKTNDYITELPSWDINPPLELSRGER